MRIIIIIGYKWTFWKYIKINCLLFLVVTNAHNSKNNFHIYLSTTGLWINF